MKPKLLLRIAALLMFLHVIGHTIGALTWRDAPNPSVGAVITGMQKEHFPFMGRDVSIASFYEGYGISMIVVLLFVSQLLWICSTVFHRRTITLIAVFLLTLGIVEFIYFFPLPAVLSFVAGLFTLVSLRKTP